MSEMGCGRASGRPAGWSTARRRDTRLDNYVDRYAARTHGMTASAIRALFAVANRPEVVSLAGGMPNIADLPLDVVGSTLDAAGADRRPAGHAVRIRPGRAGHPRGHLRGDEARRDQRPSRRRDRHRRLAAGPGPGHPDLLRPRRRGAGRGAELRRRARGVPVLPVRGRARRHGRVRPGPVGALPRRSPRCAAAGRTVKFLYTIPNYQNPAGVTQTLERRTEILAQVAERADVLVVEDNPYGLLGFDGDPIPAMRSMNEAPWSTWGRSPRPSLRASGSAGCSRRTPSGRSWCWPRSRPPCARRCSPSSPSPRTWPTTTGAVRSRSSGRCTGSAGTR